MASSKPGRAGGGLLQAAVDTFDKKHDAMARSKPGAMFLSSSPQPPPSSQNVLKAASVSALNVQRPHAPRYMPNQGVKRMSNGLAKVNDGSFEDATSSAKRMTQTGMSQSKKPIEVIEIDENDFESDVDLDIEEPRQSAPLALPQTITPSRMPKSIVYPTLPRQQQMHSTYRDVSDVAMPSSTPFDWSSSPAHHMQAQKSATASTLYSDIQPTFQTSSTLVPPPKLCKAAPRTLPWAHTDSIDLTQDSARAPIVTDRNLHTPLGADKRKKNPISDLWNRTASTVKEQQKKHREEARPAVKKSEVSEETRSIATTQRKKIPRVFLSEEQEHVLSLVVKEKDSMFFTGSAGTGKSVLLREIIAAFRREYKKEPDRVAVTASTGLAACNIGGVTLHSFAGIGLGKEEASELVKKVKRNAKAKQRWLRTKVLIVDEVSMVDADLFDKLETVARLIRNNGRPFGGIQLVITGDFFQLPPVPDSGRVARFCFDAGTWQTTVKHTIGLHHVFRQKDPVFAGMLNEMREGRLSSSSIEAFKKLNRPLKYEDSVGATELFPTRREVEKANGERLLSLQGESFVFEAKDGGAIQDKVARDKLLSNCMAPETITLKKGAQVMLIKNIDEDLVNGSVGRVIAFMNENEFEKFTLDEDVFAKVDEGAMQLGQKDLSMSKEDRARRRLQDNLNTSRKYPVVRFSLADGTSRDMMCQHESWKIELPSGEVQASRSQIPLILSWALSIHKAQGQTLERVKVDLGTVFEKGQAYVALSRATSMAGLQVLRFDATKVLAHDRVRTFYSNLAKVESLTGKQTAAAA